MLRKQLRRSRRTQLRNRLPNPRLPFLHLLRLEGEEDGQRREPMSRLRQRIAQHLVSAQHSAAMLTTFNEIDLSAVMELRALYKERFAEVHGISLGLCRFSRARPCWHCASFRRECSD